MRLDQLTPELLDSAIRIYCEYAYGRDVPDRIPHFAPPLSPQQIIAGMLDESAPDPTPHRRYALRLGSRDYPYMKFVLEECFFDGEFFLHVDTHDEIDLDPRSPDYSAWVGLRALNRRVKEAVESAWWDAHLPTLRALRERLIAEGGTDQAGSREEIILLVEDPTAVNETMALALAKRGFASLGAGTSDEAVRRAVMARPDCIVIDSVVDGVSGRDICRRLRKEPDLAGVPLILLTARSDFLDRADSIDANVLTPVDEGVLFRTIDHLLSARKNAAQNQTP
jgi:CheY-like chemotaxis protein